MDLVVLAAGMGSRFGGLKQIQPIDEDNNFIIDYSVHDAVKAGFDRVIFIIKEEDFEIFKETIGNRLKNIVKVEYVFQDGTTIPDWYVLPSERVKPLGTVHAVLAAKKAVREPFAVINADDDFSDVMIGLSDFLRKKARLNLPKKRLRKNNNCF